ncbi:hypothetical protein E2C01_100547 [Portunus trituberculatus]|uniref:Uncharacterized protein n=1 Tax=Portunus trituberculatus TaxID=210409 RepID=A0A5B7KDC4_PORTR|nr:hypothetical protein [Portunus trituberculatus]
MSLTFCLPTHLSFLSDQSREGDSTGWSCGVMGGEWLCGWVASSRQAVRVTYPITDPRFPKGCPFAEVSCFLPQACSLINYPCHLGLRRGAGCVNICVPMCCHQA